MGQELSQGLMMKGLGDIGTHWGNVRVLLGLYGDNGEEHGNDYNGVIWREA